MVKAYAYDFEILGRHLNAHSLSLSSILPGKTLTPHPGFLTPSLLPIMHGYQPIQNQSYLCP